MCMPKVEEQCLWTCISFEQLRQAFSKWTDEYLLRLWGKRRVIDVEIKKDPDPCNRTWLAMHTATLLKILETNLASIHYHCHKLPETSEELESSLESTWGFPERGVPQIIHLSGIFLGYPNGTPRLAQPQVEERGGPSEQWPFEKFVSEMHKARRGMVGRVQINGRERERDWIDGIDDWILLNRFWIWWSIHINSMNSSIRWWTHEVIRHVSPLLSHPVGLLCQVERKDELYAACPLQS